VSVPTAGPGPLQAAFAATLVDEWRRAGVTDAVISPGSRSTPLALALAAAGLRLHVRLDERGAGFFAVGLALVSGRAPVVCTTSGTAAAELHPAVVEAHHAGVPLIVCTADRPPELHDVGAPQTIDQVHLFGRAIRFFADPGPADEAGRAAWRSLGARAFVEATGGPLGPGPVHLNLAFRDPLVAEVGPLPPGRPGGAPWHRRPAPAAPAAVAELGVLRPGRRGLLVAGAGAPGDLGALARCLRWPLLADPRSGWRGTLPGVVGAADAFLRSDRVRRALLPETIALFGAPWTSRILADFIAGAAEEGCDVVSVDPHWRWPDPGRVASVLVGALGPEEVTGTPAPGWAERWAAVETAAQSALAEVLEDANEDVALTEPVLGRRLLGALDPATRVLAASSMPVRDLEWFSPGAALEQAVVANRGTSGIDGLCSTALGMAAAGQGPVVAVLGDLAFFHDVSALVRPSGGEGASSCTLVVVDNDGGGIFSFLPQATAVAPERFERLFGTPQRAVVAEVARGFGVPTFEVSTWVGLREALAEVVSRTELAVVRAAVPDRDRNVALHDQANAAVAAAAEGALDQDR
jgi:2-succinyl-5-enolpyruvyl-6-hydroxy-3-cyclohexene-1-carboxylate synthase